MARPSTTPTWSTNATYPAGAKDWSGTPTKAAPTAGKLAQGLEPNTDQAAEEINWLYNLLSLWIAYFDAWLISVLNPTPASVGVDSPQVLINDSAAKPRWLVSHNGFPGGAINVFKEDWKIPIASNTTAGAVATNPLWFLTFAGAPIGWSTQTPPATYGGNFALLQPATTPTAKVALATNAQVMNPAATFVSWELKIDFGMDAIGVNSFTHWAGLSGSRDPNAPANGFIWFKKTSTDTNWQCQTNDGVTTNTQDSGVPPTAEGVALQRLRIEYHGSATPFAANTARFFINDVLVKTITTNLPTQLQYIAVASLCTGAGTGHDSNIGTIELNSNRYSSGGGI